MTTAYHETVLTAQELGQKSIEGYDILCEQLEKETAEGVSETAESGGPQLLLNTIPNSPEAHELAEQKVEEDSINEKTIEEEVHTDQDVRQAGESEEEASKQKETLKQSAASPQSADELLNELLVDLGTQNPAEADQMLMDVEVDANQAQPELILQQESEDQEEVDPTRRSKKRKLMDLEEEDITSEDLEQDQDIMFLVSLMPALKRVRTENVNMVRTKIIKAIRKGIGNRVSVASSTDDEPVEDLLQNIQEDFVSDISNNQAVA